MSNITVIIPIHEFNDVIAGYLDKAVESILKQEHLEELPHIAIVSSALIENDVINYFSAKYSNSNLNLNFIKNEGKTDYQSQVNLAVESVTTPYFSVLEFDDEYGTTYFRNSEKYLKSYPEVDVFLTMMIEVNEKNEGIKMTNETVWAQQFVGENGEMGYLNINALKQYTDFKLSGAIIKKSEFKNIGGFKTNIQLTFGYEFLLRALNNACKVFSMPRIGYKHLATREDSLFGQLGKNMPMDERKFWFETANREANFPNDRLIDMSRLQKTIVV
jgi:hypothetical protein